MGILQSRILEWVALPSSRGYLQPKDRTQVSTLQVASLLSHREVHITYTSIKKKLGL